VLPILFTINTARLTNWVDERVQAEGLSFIDDLGWIAKAKDVKHVVIKLETCAAESIKWAS
jgi:hypothetical protein